MTSLDELARRLPGSSDPDRWPEAGLTDKVTGGRRGLHAKQFPHPRGQMNSFGDASCVGTGAEAERFAGPKEATLAGVASGAEATPAAVPQRYRSGTAKLAILGLRPKSYEGSRFSRRSPLLSTRGSLFFMLNEASRFFD